MNITVFYIKVFSPNTFITAIHDATVWEIASLVHLNTFITFKSLVIEFLKYDGYYSQKLENDQDLYFELSIDYGMNSRQCIMVMDQF